MKQNKREVQLPQSSKQGLPCRIGFPTMAGKSHRNQRAEPLMRHQQSQKITPLSMMASVLSTAQSVASPGSTLNPTDTATSESKRLPAESHCGHSQLLLYASANLINFGGSYGVTPQRVLEILLLLSDSQQQHTLTHTHALMHEQHSVTSYLLIVSGKKCNTTHFFVFYNVL